MRSDKINERPRSYEGAPVQLVANGFRTCTGLVADFYSRFNAHSPVQLRLFSHINHHLSYLWECVSSSHNNTIYSMKQVYEY